MDFQPFKNLFSLKTLQLQLCHLELNCFESLVNNAPSLNKLSLNCNKAVYDLDSSNQNQVHSIFKSSFKFPQILEIDVQNDSYYLEDLLFEDLIQCNLISMNCLSINLHRGFNPLLRNCFIQFLKCSKIRLLQLDHLRLIPKFDYDGFCKFLKNSQYLQGLSLHRLCNSTINSGLMINALSFNKTIKVLVFSYLDLRGCYPDLINMISTNTIMSTLVIEDYGLKIDIKFMEAIIKNKTLSYLILTYIEIEKQIASKLLESNLKGINLDNSIDKESEDLI